MAKLKFITMLQRRLRNTLKFCYGAIAKRLRKLLRPVFDTFNRRSNARAGFVLPTAALLLLVVSLVIGAILIRTLNRTDQVIGQRQEKVIYNAATPAIDRAKAKIEYLFKNDPRLPGGVPSEDRLLAMMVNAGTPDTPQLNADEIGNPYQLPDEERIELGGNPDSLAWRYPYDSNGDGENDSTIAYSIIFEIPDSLGALQNQSTAAIANRAEALQVRNGPLSAEAKPGCENVGTTSRIEAGWLKDATSSAILRKNFQINAVAVPDDPNNGTVATLELQQDRQADRGNKWGAWFRYDLEIAPGQPFYWNGAMHTDGSMIVGNNKLEAFLVSGPGSCIFRAGADTSEVTLAVESAEEDEDEAFVGQAMAASLGNNSSRDRMRAVFHEWVAEDQPNYGAAGGGALDRLTLSNTNHSVVGALPPADITLDPVKVFTEDVSTYRGDFNDNLDRDAWSFPVESDPDTRRIYRGEAERPYIDDFYRADNRFGPRPGYGADPDLNLALVDGVGLGVRNGDEIAGREPRLTTLDPVGDGLSPNPTELGLDGFWERRAWREGMRVIVGPRLELGNDPLPVPTDYVREDLDLTASGPNPTNATRKHETLQRRALRDNLAAVQATAIYHQAAGSEDPGYPPIAAVATTVHPGTADTLKRSASFEKPNIGPTNSFGIDPANPNYTAFFSGNQFGDNPDEILVDFLTGRGTNGWEFAIPDGFFDRADVQTALENLASFAGDYEGAEQGAFPPTQGTEIHPYPELTKWGNFSNLRRALQAGNGSIADESYQHTAALTLGMLAYNISYLDAFDYAQNLGAITDLLNSLKLLRDGDRINGEIAYYPTEDLDKSGALNLGPNGPEDFNDDNNLTPAIPTVEIYGDGDVFITRMTPSPEAFIRGLEEIGAPDEQIELARLIYLKEQVQRDRKFGFRPSPTTTSPNFEYTIQAPFNEDLNADGTFEPGEDINGNGGPDPDIFEEDDGSGNPVTDFDNDGQLDAPGVAGYTPPTIGLGCDYTAPPNDFFGAGAIPAPGDEVEQARLLTLATSLCPAAPKFPSLYYLFPLDNHGHSTVTVDLNGDGTQNAQDQQPTTEDIDGGGLENGNGILDLGEDVNNNGIVDTNSYINDPYIQALNGGVTYSAIADLTQIALKPQPIASWILPHQFADPNSLCDNDASATNINPNCGRYNLIYDGVNEEYHRVAFKDTGFFNGREMMNVRALSMDLNMLKEEGPNGDLWLAVGNDDDLEAGGIVYAFREDAVREDGVARPSGGASCQTFTEIIAPGCQAQAGNDNPQDPAVNPDNGISPKPVDMYPDPDRRPYGFRLINGADLSRDSAGLTSYGLTFVSDNATYLQGNFNCHAARAGDDNSCPEPIEEFNFTIRDKAGLAPNAYRQAFYDRRDDQRGLNDDFATPENDIWRFSEVLVDGLTILSDNFCEGSIEDGFLMAGTTLRAGNLNTLLGSAGVGRSARSNPNLTQIYGCGEANGVYTSYLNQNRPRNPTPPENWQRENPADPSSPIKISKNGNPLLVTGDDYRRNYFEFFSNEPGTNNADMKAMNRAKDQQLNGVFLSGIIPSQANQTYGGLHNFPRFIEDWVGFDASINGSFYQLNFSTQATGSFDQDAWEPNTTPGGDNLIYYYGAPNRFWGYDTALQLAPPGPISERLVTINNRRSEFYRELPLDDPYINQLYQAVRN
ncbi:MAG: hormogonium polysaccharide biosynthesis protein HpsA [Cyanobacteriota bacterium]|nr:hormogonium polysaccharide biosynthesis protein HpsA [Cyanobacteriota bacterium]